jgi:hypothetical protein
MNGADFRPKKEEGVIVVSVRKIAACIGLTGSFSLKRDFFGYTSTFFGVPSVFGQLRLLQGPHIHLNLIKVGSELFNATDELYADFALAFMRSSYATVGIGVGRVEHYAIPIAQAEGHEQIDSDSEAETLISRFIVPNVGIDVFVVRSYVGDGHAGLSPVSGTCNKNDKGMKGCVVAPTENVLGFGHEVGHYLGLEHSGRPDNLMNPTPSENKLDSFQIADITDENGTHPEEVPQGDIMKTHCAIRAGCPA